MCEYDFPRMPTSIKGSSTLECHEKVAERNWPGQPDVGPKAQGKEMVTAQRRRRHAERHVLRENADTEMATVRSKVVTVWLMVGEGIHGACSGPGCPKVSPAGRG